MTTTSTIPDMGDTSFIESFGGGPVEIQDEVQLEQNIYLETAKTLIEVLDEKYDLEKMHKVSIAARDLTVEKNYLDKIRLRTTNIQSVQKLKDSSIDLTTIEIISRIHATMANYGTQQAKTD